METAYWDSNIFEIVTDVKLEFAERMAKSMPLLEKKLQNCL
jgi:hypothetical protein